jgi:fructose-specific PTS system IIA-like component
MATLTANCIDLNIQGNSVYSILKQLADMAFQNGYVSDRNQFLQTLLAGKTALHRLWFGYLRSSWQERLRQAALRSVRT